MNKEDLNKSFSKLLNSIKSINTSKIITFIKRNITTILVVLILLLLLGNTKVKNFAIKALGGYVIQETTITIDTVSIKIDTSAIIDEWRSLNVELFSPVIVIDTTIIKKDTTINNIPTTTLVVTLDSLSKYQNTVSDSLIDGVITTIIDYRKRKLLSQNFDYKAKFPRFITKTITVEKNTTTTLKNPYNIGLGTKINTLGDIGVLGAYQTNKGWQFQGSYNFGANTNNYIDVGIIKFF
jgi:hypothetical protein